MEAKFQKWLKSRGYDAQQWNPELRALLWKRFRAEQNVKPEHSIVIDSRGCSWPARAYRLESPR